MSILSEFFAGGTEGVLKGVKDVVGAFKADPLELAKLETAIAKTEMELTLGLSQAQTKINEIESASADKFASRWRPACGWIGFIGIAYATIFHPLATWVSLNFGLVPPPQLDTVILMELVTGMLGLAGLRTYDKLKRNQ